jgi:hypothetical protein
MMAREKIVSSKRMIDAVRKVVTVEPPSAWQEALP